MTRTGGLPRAARAVRAVTLVVCLGIAAGGCEAWRSGDERRAAKERRSNPAWWSAPREHRVVTLLGERRYGILLSADRCESYELRPGVVAHSGENLLGRYPIVSRVPDLSPEQLQVLRNELLDPTTYTVAKPCLFSPELGFSLHSAEGTLNVIVCFGCRVVRFESDGDQTGSHFSMEFHGAMEDLAGDLFPGFSLSGVARAADAGSR